MAQIKIVKVTYFSGDTYGTISEDSVYPLLEGTDWEEMDNKDVYNLKNFLHKRNNNERYNYQKGIKTQYIVVEQIEKEDIQSVMDTIKREMKEDQEKEEKKKAAAEKRKVTMAQKKKERELKKLQELKNKYGENA